MILVCNRKWLVAFHGFHLAFWPNYWETTVRIGPLWISKIHHNRIEWMRS